MSIIFKIIRNVSFFVLILNKLNMPIFRIVDKPERLWMGVIQLFYWSSTCINEAFIVFLHVFINE
jgi:hypothetical protein